MSKTSATQEDWTGLMFGNDWEILKKYNCAEYRALYTEATGDTTKKIKNVHYLVENKNCGIKTYMERTVIERALNNQTPIMSKCKGCNNCSRINDNTCYYAEMCRNKHLGKIPERTSKIEIGKIYGNFYVEEIKPSGNYSDHQCRAIIKCRWCGTKQERRFDTILNCAVACDCFRNHSSGEKIVQEWLNQHNIKNKSEYIFENLYGIGGGSLRYDFAILNEKDQPIKLIEVDGDQHFEETGSFYNPTGKVQIHDAIKNNFAKEHNIPLLRITYDQLLDLDNFIIDFLN